MRKQTTKHLFFLGMMLLGIVNINAQEASPVKVKVVTTTVDTMTYGQDRSPIIAGLPMFFVNFETSLREKPDHRSDVKIRLTRGMKVEVLDPYNYIHWTKIKVGDRIGWAKKAYLDPVSGEIDHKPFLKGNSKS